MTRQPRDGEAALRIARAALTVGDFTLWSGRYLFTPKGQVTTGRRYSAQSVNRLIEEGYAKRVGRRVTLNAR